ncbi:DUF6861 domain-containing protein [Pseudomonas abietaniphila]|uniref:Novel toxin 15 n=1 Tax=Pseudomonas abietaniphila TaxID=89065 RepID=A0A1G8KJT3_9PSED|nr:polymorphic toxin type 15 domain-containing protein [Pseudomonas abietaniphila]SDI43636.1 Novel toxin 15 [Pseudomonas abietaniphila]
MFFRNIVPSWFELEKLIADTFARRTHRHPNDHTHLSGPAAHSPVNRAHKVRMAFHQALSIAAQMMRQRFADLDIDDVMSELLDVVSQAAMIMVASLLTGALIGGGVGALAGGIGALPGAVAGSAIGLKASGSILAALGLTAVAEFFVDGLPEIAGYYWRGINIAWDSPQPLDRYCCGDPMVVARAAREIALGHVAMVALLLSAIGAYLTRGRGQAQALASEMQQTAKGSKLAQWMLKHEDALKRRSDLQHRGPVGNGRIDSADAQKPPSERQRQEQPRVKKPLGMPEHNVPCFNAGNLPTKKIPEFDRQLDGQQGGLNDLTVDEYLRGRAAFKTGDVIRDPKVATKARLDLSDFLIKTTSAELSSKGMPLWEAEQAAIKITQKKMSMLAALHNPDLVAGGKDKISDFGDRNVNSSIGAQWRRRIDGLDEAAKKINVSQRADTKINTKLTRCK